MTDHRVCIVGHGHALAERMKRNMGNPRNVYCVALGGMIAGRQFDTIICPRPRNDVEDRYVQEHILCRLAPGGTFIWLEPTA